MSDHGSHLYYGIEKILGKEIIETVFRAMHEGLVVVDREGTILYINPSYTRILGIRPEQILGKKLRDIEPTAKLLNVLEEGTSILERDALIRSVGKTVVLNNLPIRRSGSTIGAVSVFRDITEVESLSDRLRKTELLTDALKDELIKTSPIPFNLRHIVGFSGKLMEAIHILRKVAPTDASVLIRGESGTGKEVFARATHDLSQRKAKPLVTINCSAIPENLMETEFFGYDRGAFTGARAEGKPGKFELAHQGTLFLDEVGDMSLSMQMKLLRVLETQEFERVGGVQTQRVSTRIIAATSRNLEEMIENGKFREDLYYRINVVSIYLPPLRERDEDIGPLVDLFIEQYRKKGLEVEIRVSPEVMDFFRAYEWPGNVRELQHVIEHSLVMMEGNSLEMRYLPAYIRNWSKGINKKERRLAVGRPASTLKQKVMDLERNMITDILEQTRYNKTKAIQILGMSRRTFYKKLKDLEIES
jgi:PAS domain S-box-containing protein